VSGCFDADESWSTGCSRPVRFAHSDHEIDGDHQANEEPRSGQSHHDLHQQPDYKEVAG